MKYLFCILFCCVFVCTHAQKKGQWKQENNLSQKLVDAQMMQKKSPDKAILLLEEVLTQSKKIKGDPFNNQASYLLGSIYADLDQNKLALERFNQIETRLVNTKDTLLAKTYLKKGNIYLAQNNFKAATQSYELCVNLNPPKNISLSCMRALVDTRLAEGDQSKVNVEQITEIYDSYDNDLDDNDVIELDAQKNQVLIQQNQIEDAEKGYGDLFANANIEKVNPKTLGSIEKTKKEILKRKETPLSKIDFTEKSLERKKDAALPADALMTDIIDLFDLYWRRADYEKAAQYVDEGASLIARVNDIYMKKNYYEQAVKYYKRQENYEQAFLAQQEWTTINDQIQKEERSKNKVQLDALVNARNLDIKEKDYFIQEKDEQILQSQVRNQRLLIGFLSFLLLAALISFYFIMKNVRAKRKANQLLLLKSLRSQMNPHFIFNALNSVNQYIALNDERAANQYLTDFSKLMRMVLDQSQKDFIPLEEEVHLLQLYLKLEHARFQDKFEYSFENKIQQGTSISLPPMLIQPFVENAVWHGLRYKKSKGELLVRFYETNKNIEIQIQDNGIGRKQSKALKTLNQQTYNSTGLKNIHQRLAVINELYQKNYSISIEDVDSSVTDTGTRVYIKIPKT